MIQSVAEATAVFCANEVELTAAVSYTVVNPPTSPIAPVAPKLPVDPINPVLPTP